MTDTISVDPDHLWNLIDDYAEARAHEYWQEDQGVGSAVDRAHKEAAEARTAVRKALGLEQEPGHGLDLEHDSRHYAQAILVAIPLHDAGRTHTQIADVLGRAGFRRKDGEPLTAASVKYLLSLAGK